MSFMLTASGREYHFTGSATYLPEGRPVRVHDIAHQLAQINRFHGAAMRPESVAEHSLLVSEIAERDGASVMVQLAALFHDAHECVTNDLASPAKMAVNDMRGGDYTVQPWRTFEGQHAKHFRARLGLTVVFATARAQIQRYDLMALATERRDLMQWTADTHEPWAVLRDGEENAIRAVDWVDLATAERAAVPWTTWRDRFLARHEELAFIAGRRLGDA